MERILFVDDDLDILKLNKTYFSEYDYLTDTASDGETARELLKTYHYGCVVLDILMNGLEGFELCRLIQEEHHFPVIFLTNLSQEEMLVKGFECGGDDYLTKPYLMKELEMRIKARVRNANERPMKWNGLRLDANEKQGYVNGVSLGLTVNEFEILFFLTRHRGQAFRQEEIYREIWGEGYYNTHSVQVLIMRIRKKIQQLSPEKEYIKTQWGKGYVINE